SCLAWRQGDYRLPSGIPRSIASGQGRFTGHHSSPTLETRSIQAAGLLSTQAQPIPLWHAGLQTRLGAGRPNTLESFGVTPSRNDSFGWIIGRDLRIRSKRVTRNIQRK